jgi:hypothetical protein
VTTKIEAFWHVTLCRSWRSEGSYCLNLQGHAAVQEHPWPRRWRYRDLSKRLELPTRRPDVTSQKTRVFRNAAVAWLRDLRAFKAFFEELSAPYCSVSNAVLRLPFLIKAILCLQTRNDYRAACVKQLAKLWCILSYVSSSKLKWQNKHTTSRITRNISSSLHYI